MIVDVTLLDLIDTAMFRCGNRRGPVSVEAVVKVLLQTRPDLAVAGRELDDLIAASAVSYHLPVDFDRLS